MLRPVLHMVRLKRPAARIFFVFEFGGHAAADVPLGFVDFKNLFDFLI